MFPAVKTWHFCTIFLSTTKPIFKNFSILLYILLHGTADVDAFSCCVYCRWILFAKMKPFHKHDEMKTNRRQLSTCSIYSVCWQGRSNEFQQCTLKMSITCSCLIHPICPVSQNCFNVHILSDLQSCGIKQPTFLFTQFLFPSSYTFLDLTIYINFK